MSTPLPEEERKILLEHARSSIQAALLGLPAPRLANPPMAIRQPAACFVTLRVRPHGALRGCIGHVDPSDPLWVAIGDVAVAAALRDPRFPPVSIAELDGLAISISVLGPLEAAAGPHEVCVGTHGLYLRARGRSGLLLPQVATEFGWDAQEFVERVCEKAGLPPDAWKEPGAQLFRFAAQTFSEES